MEWFKEQGWEVHVAAAGEVVLPFVDQKYNLPINRSPLSGSNFQAYRQLKSIIDDNDYKIIHCHTPVGGVLARLAAKDARITGTKVVYTAHGFHFCKGAPFPNWLIYYPIEKSLAKYTDCLVTINDEDYKLALKHNFKANEIAHVHGVGVDIDRFKPINKNKKRELREALGYNPDGFFMFYAAEFNKNKNQSLLIKALALIKDDTPSAKLLLAGEGRLLEQCRGLALSLGVDKMVDFLGFRQDVDQLLSISDIAVASSMREGLPVNVMEAMSCGLPVIATENRGHLELVVNHQNGYIVPRSDHQLLGKRIRDLYFSKQLLSTMGVESRKRIKTYSLKNVGLELGKIYSSYMMEDHHETESKYYRANL